MFGNEFLGKAVALRRDARGWNQVQLAQEIGVTKSTMNAYERGTRRIQKETLEKIAVALKCDSIHIWEDAFRIFRYNVLHDRAEAAGTSAEALAASLDRGPSFASIRAKLRPIGELAWQAFAEILAFLRPERFYETHNAAPEWRVVVRPPARKPRKPKSEKTDENAQAGRTTRRQTAGR